MENKRGLFVAFEGIDGCGKSTQIRKFVEYLFELDKHNHVVLTREPYKDASIRKFIQSHSDPFSQARHTAELYINDRETHVNDLIVPNLEKGHIVISDRFKLSTITYQHAQGLDIHELIEMQKHLPVPDITFVVDVSVDEAFERMNKDNRDYDLKKHKFESSKDFQNKCRQNFQKAKEILSNEKIVIINGEQEPEKVFQDIVESFEKHILKKKVKYNSMDEVPEEIKEELKKYFSNVGGDVFTISGLPSELTGGALARYSRAPTGLQLTIINEFFGDNGKPSQAKGSELMDRVLNAYGDDSVGELEGTHVGIENVSMIAIKTIEDRRIGGSPIEQSTRYVKYDKKDKNGNWRYLRPKELIEAGLLDKYERVNNLAFEVYVELVIKLQEYFKQKFPESEFEIEVVRNGEKRKVKKFELQGANEERAFANAYGFTIRCAALDVGRCVLPSSTLSQLGVFGNGRFFTNLITSLKCSELKEEKEKGYELEEELKKVIPTFVKRNFESSKFKDRNVKMRQIAKSIFYNVVPNDDSVTLVSRAEHIDEILAGVLFPYTNISNEQILKEVVKLPYDKKLEVLKEYVGEREGRRDRTPRGFEAGYPITFDLVGCFAEYRDLQRHRMVTQQRQLLTTDLGFIMPSEVIEIGMQSIVETVVKMMEELHQEVKEKIGDVVAQYVTLFNHRLRFCMGMNLREFQHLSELRTVPQGHYSYRAMTMEMARELEKRDGWSQLTHEFVDYTDPGNKISRAKEQSRIAGKNLATGIDSGVDFV